MDHPPHLPVMQWMRKNKICPVLNSGAYTSQRQNPCTVLWHIGHVLLLICILYTHRAVRAHWALVNLTCCCPLSVGNLTFRFCIPCAPCCRVIPVVPMHCMCAPRHQVHLSADHKATLWMYCIKAKSGWPPHRLGFSPRKPRVRVSCRIEVGRCLGSLGWQHPWCVGHGAWWSCKCVTTSLLRGHSTW